jgi:hypothetical protein
MSRGRRDSDMATRSLIWFTNSGVKVLDGSCVESPRLPGTMSGKENAHLVVDSVLFPFLGLRLLQSTLGAGVSRREDGLSRIRVLHGGRRDRRGSRLLGVLRSPGVLVGLWRRLRAQRGNRHRRGILGAIPPSHCASGSERRAVADLCGPYVVDAVIRKQSMNAHVSLKLRGSRV